MGKTKSPASDGRKQARQVRHKQKIIKKQNKRDKIVNKKKNKQIRMLRCIHQNENNKKKINTYKSKESKRIKQTIRKRKIKQVNSTNRKINRLNIKKRISNQQNKKNKSNLKKVKKQKVDQNFYQIDKIIKYRKSDDGYQQYFVSWVGYPSTANCWVDKDRIKGHDLQNLQQYLQELSIQSDGQDINIVEDAEQVRQENNDQFLDSSQSKQYKQGAIKIAKKRESQLAKSKLKNKVQNYQIISIQEDSDKNYNEVRQQLAYPSRRTRHKNACKIYHFPNHRLNNNKLSNKRGNTKKKIKIIPHPHKYKYRYSTSNASKLAGNKINQTFKKTNSKKIQQSQQIAQKEKGWERGNNYVEIDGELEEINQESDKKQKNEKLFFDNSQEQKSKSRSKEEQISHQKIAPITSEINNQFLHLPSLHKLSKEELDILRRFYYPHIP